MRKKICKCCGRNRKIGKFGNLSASPDGKNRYCRECMRKFTNGYRCTPKGRSSVRKSKKKWRQNNKDKIKEYNKKYYKRKRKIILYNKRAREETECILIYENPKNNSNLKINKSRKVCSEIIINPNPKRKNGK